MQHKPRMPSDLSDHKLGPEQANPIYVPCCHSLGQLGLSQIDIDFGSCCNPFPSNNSRSSFPFLCYSTGIDSSSVAIHGDFLPIGEDFGCCFCADYARDTQLAADNSCVSSPTTTFGDYSHSSLHRWHKIRTCHFRY